MKIVFFGSSEFAVASLNMLFKSHDVMAIVTQPDREKGRKLQLSKTPVKICAQKNDIEIYQPEDICAEEAISKLKSYNADLFVVVSFGRILTKEVLEIPKLYCINVHASLLPRWRGASPVNRAIINKDQTTGVSIIRMNELMDAGDILLTKSLEIDPEDDAVILMQKLGGLGAEALLEAVKVIEGEKVSFIQQDETLVTIAHKLKKTDGLIDWQEEAECIHNKVRGLLPWPCAYTYYKGKFLKILKTRVVCPTSEQKEYSSGEIIVADQKEGISVATGKEIIVIEMLQPEGKRVMSAQDFLLGHKVIVGDKLCQS
ncbi:MAG: methionyl-tRNA formyltransferase [PVC group bacterium]|nr:methionyl-tRNA formyltransferase [PVC group bacterium]